MSTPIPASNNLRIDSEEELKNLQENPVSANLNVKSDNINHKQKIADIKVSVNIAEDKDDEEIRILKKQYVIADLNIKIAKAKLEFDNLTDDVEVNKAKTKLELGKLANYININQIKKKNI